MQNRIDLECRGLLTYETASNRREESVLDGERAYRVEERFQDTVALFGPEPLRVTETDEGTCTLSAFHSYGVEYILSTQRNPDQARQFSDLGGCVQYALKLTGISVVEFRLQGTYRK